MFLFNSEDLICVCIGLNMREAKRDRLNSFYIIRLQLKFEKLTKEMFSQFSRNHT